MTDEPQLKDNTVYLDSSAQIEQLEGVLAYNKELVGAKMKILLASHALARTEGSFLASIENILPEPDFNLRLVGPELDAHIRDIADSIKREGFRQNESITVYGSMRGKKPVFIISDGYCRHSAALLAKSEGCDLNYLPITIKPAETTNEDLIFGMIQSGRSSKLKLSPYEISIGCKRLRTYNVPYEVIAQRLGFTVEYVHQLLELAGAPYAIRAMVENGQLTAALAISSMRSHGAEAEKILTTAFEAVKREGKTKLTAKSLPDQAYKKAIKKHALKMHDALMGVRESRQFLKLPVNIRDLIEELFATLDSTKKITETTINPDENL